MKKRDIQAHCLLLKLLKSLLFTSANVPVNADAERTPPPAQITAPDTPPLDFGAVLEDAAGFPIPDWPTVQGWVDSIPNEHARAQAWCDCEQAWLQHMQVALGAGFHLRTQGSALLLSSLPGHVADATLAFVNKTVTRIVRALDGVAEVAVGGYDILIVFDDENSYYRYVSHCYPEEGEFAASGGMYINHGCGHFVTVKADLRAVEPVIAHELTHACLDHLPIPAWLNEGLAVNTEQLLCPPLPTAVNLQQLKARHRKFWGPKEIQEFWSGASFLRSDEGNTLSYDLARILVRHLAADWDRFRPFALEADLADSAAAAATKHLGVDLGAAVCAALELEPDSSWSPDPKAWLGSPEHGAF